MYVIIYIYKHLHTIHVIIYTYSHIRTIICINNVYVVLCENMVLYIHKYNFILRIYIRMIN